MLTKVEKIIEKEKQDAVDAAKMEVRKEEREKADNRVKEEREKAENMLSREREKAENMLENQLIEIAKNMLLDGDSVEKISRNIGLSMSRLEEMKTVLLQN